MCIRDRYETSRRFQCSLCSEPMLYGDRRRHGRSKSGLAQCPQFAVENGSEHEPAIARPILQTGLRCDVGSVLSEYRTHTFLCRLSVSGKERRVSSVTLFG